MTGNPRGLVESAFVALLAGACLAVPNGAAAGDFGSERSDPDSAFVVR